ncbi:MAG: hypothetical protein LUF28_04600 [Clostridiales bacterium]|nr:hypothetical protein [Clostridiales bacterium]
MRQNDNSFGGSGAPSPGERAGRAVRRHALLFRGVILLLLAAYLGGVGYVLYADTEVSSRFWGVFLLAVGTALALRLLLAVWDELTRRRVSRKDLQTRRDYNAYLAHWRKDAASRNAALLAMGKAGPVSGSAGAGAAGFGRPDAGKAEQGAVENPLLLSGGRRPAHRG